MSAKRWRETAFSLGTEPQLWELFHENSKLGRFSPVLSQKELREWLCQLHDSLPFDGYPAVPLPKHLPDLKVPLGKTILSRVSVRELVPHPLKLECLAALLHFAYGVNRDTAVSDFVRPLRVVPSAGGLYPLEIFFHSSKVQGLSPGLYHYNPSRYNLRRIREGDQLQQIAQSFVQTAIPLGASLLIFITAMFERSVFKYVDRGYRYALLEAGHVAQNMNLLSSALGLGCLNIGGFFDREIDTFLQLDGIAHSTIYVIAIGGKNHDRSRKRRYKG